MTNLDLDLGHVLREIRDNNLHRSRVGDNGHRSWRGGGTGSDSAALCLDGRQTAFANELGLCRVRIRATRTTLASVILLLGDDLVGERVVNIWNGEPPAEPFGDGKRCVQRRETCQEPLQTY